MILNPSTNQNKVLSADPILKWAGGKRQLIEQFKPLFPRLVLGMDDKNGVKECLDVYCEPFTGGGAVFFNFLFAGTEKVFLNDINEELINVMRIVKDGYSLEYLLGELKNMENTEEFFYQTRNLDRDKEKYKTIPSFKKASRILYLNKTCFNGLYRVNRKGEFNVPFGKYKKPNIVNEDGLRKAHEYLSAMDVQLSSMDFCEIIDKMIAMKKENHALKIFVYLDPPYIPVSETASFTSYAKDSFSMEDQIQLWEKCNQLDENGILFMLSNSEHSFIYEYYGEKSKEHGRLFNIQTVTAGRAINSKGDGRGKVKEVVVRNYNTP